MKSKTMRVSREFKEFIESLRREYQKSHGRYVSETETTRVLTLRLKRQK